MNIKNKNFRTRKFSYFSSEDPCDLRFGHEICWSRIYEYPFVLNEIANFIKITSNCDVVIHNASWGFCDIHLVFKTWLDCTYPNTFHSDIRPSSLWRTMVWDITTPPSEALIDRFDIVINVSTLEEVSGEHSQIIENHLDQLRVGGYFIGTFDVPGLQLPNVELALLEKIVTPPSKLSPRNSRLEDKKLGLADSFAVGYVVIERIS